MKDDKLQLRKRLDTSQSVIKIRANLYLTVACALTIVALRYVGGSRRKRNEEARMWHNR